MIVSDRAHYDNADVDVRKRDDLSVSPAATSSGTMRFAARSTVDIGERPNEVAKRNVQTERPGKSLAQRDQDRARHGAR